MKAQSTVDVRDSIELTIKTKGLRRLSLALYVLDLAAWICRRLGVNVRTQKPEAQ